MSSFEALGIRAEILLALNDLRFHEPTSVQQQAIPLLLDGTQDMVALAQTGTGKTAAFGIPLLERIETDLVVPQALVLAPTRELCMQIAKDLRQLAAHLPGIKVVSVYGGASIRDQIRGIRAGANVVVATPGRLIDLLERKAIELDQVTTVVLDEADEMLNMGFQEDISMILSHTPPSKRVWLFSATMNREVQRIAANYMHDARQVKVEADHTPGEGITHQYAMMMPRDRYPALRRFIDATPDMFAIVFCRTKRETQELAESLVQDGYNADAIHGDLSQPQRDRVMGRYRNKSIQLLIATDVAARGIDVDNVSHVIHFTLPKEAESYTHRSGRTGRAGHSGISLSMIGPRDSYRVRDLERRLKLQFTQVQVPDAASIRDQRLQAFIGQFKEAPVHEEVIGQLAATAETDLAEFSREELIMRMVAMEFSRNKAEYKDAHDLNVAPGDRPRAGQRTPGNGAPTTFRHTHSAMRSMFINLGTKDGFDKGRMLGYLCGITGLEGQHFGRIHLKEAYSFIDIDQAHFMEAMGKFRAANYRGRKVRVDEGGGAPPARNFKPNKKKFDKARTRAWH